MGCPCRTLVASLLTGLESLVGFIREDAASSDYHIAGFARLNPDMKKFCAAASLAPYVAEAFLSEMMDDPRLPMRLAFLKQCVLEEQQWLDGLPFQVWVPIAEIVGCAAPGLRADTISAGHISVASAHKGILRSRKASMESGFWGHSDKPGGVGLWARACRTDCQEDSEAAAIEIQ